VPCDVDRIKRLSIIDGKDVNMARLAIVGSSKVNGVSQLHARKLIETVFSDFYQIYPEKFLGITNGVTQRRWLLKANPRLAKLITSKIGDKWIIDLSHLKELEQFVDDEDFIKELIRVKLANKSDLVDVIEKRNPLRDKTGKIVSRIRVSPNSIFDIQVKRIHEYKRQLMNALHILMQYNEIKANPNAKIIPRTYIFAGKAAPGYKTAKDIIQFINILARKINNDPDIEDKIKIVFMENYNVSLAEKIIPAADVSEQISTAGMEAAGTGNNKFAMNGALTVGTWDGSTIEMAEQIGQDNKGEENVFLFGKKAEEVDILLQNGNYDPKRDMYDKYPEIKQLIDQLWNNELTDDNDEQKILWSIADRLVYKQEDGTPGDRYLVLADLLAYRDTQHQIDDLYRNPKAWGRKMLLNIARMGYFSSDRSIREYSEKVWDLKTVET
ncbi:MAG: glycogen/starch/alpha-glucan phosphorylase, partial [Candidatus Margulisbacteria bacterium]|nr:glycogen/starch/alpha-glucan phosphorylase [Candidatus Margulisiibacteriota bacterium]